MNKIALKEKSSTGFHLWMPDPNTKEIIWFGLFKSLTLSIRDATKTYLCLDNLSPLHYSEDKLEIVWTLKQGIVDKEFVEGALKTKEDTYKTDYPKFQISFDGSYDDSYGSFLSALNSLSIHGLDKIRTSNSGRYDIKEASVESVTLSLTAESQVSDVEWRGVAKAISYADETIEQFKTRTNSF